MQALAITLAVVVSLAGLSSARAVSIPVELKSTENKAGGFIFGVTNEQLADGTVRFRVVVSEGATHFGSTLIAPILFKINAGSQPFKNTVRDLTAERQGHSIVCVFSVDKAALGDPDLCFLFTDEPDSTSPHIDFVYFRLGKFAERQRTANGRQ